MVAELQAGVGRVDITPPPDIPNGIWRAQRHIRATGIDQPLLATALVLTDGVEQVAILDLDLCLLSDRQARAIREAVSARAGIPMDRVWPCVTHNHAGPVTFDFYEGEGADRVHAYIAALPELCARAVLLAIGSRRPARLAAGQGTCHIGVNRDLRLPEGRVITGPNPSGFMDPAVGVLRIDDLAEQPIACVVTYGCHPTVLGPANMLVSPDYPGTTRRTVEAITGATCVFLQGAGGNVGPIKTFVKDATVAHRLGAILGCEAARVFLELRTRPVHERLDHVLESGAPLAIMAEDPLPEPPARLYVMTGQAPLPIRRPLSALYQGAIAELRHWEAVHTDLVRQGAPAEEVSQAFQCLTRARLRADRARYFEELDVYSAELAGLAVGNLALVATWGEPYAEIGAAVKRQSPFAQTLFVGYLGGDPTYIPWPDAYTDPAPMEVDHSPFAPTAAGILVEAALGLLRDLAARRQDVVSGVGQGA